MKFSTRTRLRTVFVGFLVRTIHKSVKADLPQNGVSNPEMRIFIQCQGNRRVCAETQLAASHKQARRLTLRLGKKLIYG